MNGKVVVLVRPVEEIVAEYPGKWMVIELADDGARGKLLVSADEMADPAIKKSIDEAFGRGRSVAVRYSGNIIPEGVTVVV